MQKSGMKKCSLLLLTVVVLVAFQFSPATETWGKSFTTQAALDISGKWTSNIGLVYEFTQNGDQFTWFVELNNQEGEGTLNGRSLSASWSEEGGRGSANGKITDVDEDGRAVRIEWDNEVVFERIGATSAPSEPALPDVSGTWNSSIGWVYEFTQNGDQFTWFVALNNQEGEGTMSDRNLSASWSDEDGTGSAEGKITAVDADGRAERIEWNNGVIFFRQ